MAYETYTTDALVCGLWGTREHDASLRLLTRDAGMLYARAGGVRADKSKLRYGLQEFSLSRVTLVHGRADWRVTGAVAIENFYFDAQARSARASVLTSMRFIRRFIHGSEVHQELFDMVVDGMRTLAGGGGARDEQLFLLRLLHYLGYVSPQPVYAQLLHTQTLAEACALCGVGQALPPAIGKTIENALAASHL